MIITYERDKSTKSARQRMTETLQGYVLHRQCVEALELRLSEPLDRPEFDDMPGEQKTRIRESM